MGKAVENCHSGGGTGRRAWVGTAQWVKGLGGENLTIWKVDEFAK
jgi:hypothetical protein